ncbi:MAG: type II toxin-antitoxin system RelE/ParE family toxin [Minisyncoccia bacterium]
MNLNTSWVLQIDPGVYKSLKKVPHDIMQRLFAEFNELSVNPFDGDIQKMNGEDNVWRKRIGAYRIRYEIIKEEKAIHIFRVERRTSKTY